jgi:glycosyltransferase involved in cell wall biosynthesis
MILNQGFPDVRVCQEALALQAQGYEVWTLVTSLDTRSPEYFAKDFNTICFNTDLSGKRSLIAKIRSLFFAYPELERRLFADSRFLALTNRIFVVHVHDLHWCHFGFSIARRLSARFVADFHENSPALPAYFGHKIISRSPRQTISNIFRSRYILSIYERWVVRRADAVITVAKENQARLENPKQNTKIYCVSNTKDPAGYPYLGLAKGSSITFLYHGSIQQNRGLRVFAEAFARTEARNIRLVILGFGKNSAEKQVIEEIIPANRTEDVTLLDWTSDLEEIKDVIMQADVGVIPHNRCELTETTLPNKLFEYFCYGKPVIVSDVAPLKRIVEETQAGYVFKAGDPSSLAQCIEYCSDKKRLEQLSANARNAAVGSYNWAVDRKELIRLYSELRSHG